MLGYICVTWFCYLFLKSICYLLLVSGREWLFASGKMTVSSRVWRSENISARYLLIHPFLLRCDVSRIHLFCTIIPYSGHKRGKEVKYMGEWCNSTVVWVKIFYLFWIV